MLVEGVGINDATYQVVYHERVGKKWKIIDRCPYYSRWAGMLRRCYGRGIPKSYNGCSVCEEWLTFSTFKTWMEKQDWEGKELDKDLLVFGNRAYSPTTCIFVSREVNMFLVSDRLGSDRTLPIGVSFEAYTGKYRAVIAESGKYKNLGRFLTPDEAKIAWLNRKGELALSLAEKETDEVIINALKARYVIGNF